MGEHVSVYQLEYMSYALVISNKKKIDAMSFLVPYT